MVAARTLGIITAVNAKDTDGSAQAVSGIRMRFMAKKTGMNASSLWIATIVLLALTAWMYFRK